MVELAVARNCPFSFARGVFRKQGGSLGIAVAKEVGSSPWQSPSARRHIGCRDESEGVFFAII